MRSPAEFLQRLSQQDMVAWAAVKDYTIKPYLAKSKYGQLADRRNVVVDEIYDYVQVEMAQNGKLVKLRDVTQIEDYMRQYVRKYVQSFYLVPKRKLETTTIDDKHWAKWEKDNRYHDWAMEIEKTNRIMDIRACVKDLWKKNPLRAYVLMFRIKNGLSARDIRSFCSLSSEGYVNKVFERAKGDVKEKYVTLRKSYGEGV